VIWPWLWAPANAAALSPDTKAADLQEPPALDAAATVPALGGGIFAASYLLCVGVAALSLQDKGDRVSLFVPVIGPFVELGQEPATAAIVPLVADGLAQAIGLMMLGGGGARSEAPPEPQAAISVAPSVGRGQCAVTVTGTW
jgi:hypothetical protein